jgi:DNA-binding transcriptional MerR regulator
MKERELKIDDIAQITGISERDIRALIQRYDSLFTYRTIGKAKLFPPKAVKIVRDLVELSRKELTKEEVIEEFRQGAGPAPTGESADEVRLTGVPLPPELVVDFRVMQETLAQQQRQISRLTADMEEEQERNRKEIERLTEQLERQRKQLAVVADWVDYFDSQMDEVARPWTERIRRSFGRSGDTEQPFEKSV